MSQRRGATEEQVRKLRQWRALPKNRRPRSIAGMAAVLGISVYVAKRAAYGMRAYATDTHRVSRGIDQPWQSHTERGSAGPTLSVASSTGTPEITGVAGSAETRYHRRADPHVETGNAGAVGRGPHFV